MALILRYFTEFGSSGTHCVKVVEGVVLKKFMFDILCPVMSFLYKNMYRKWTGWFFNIALLEILWIGDLMCCRYDAVSV